MAALGPFPPAPCLAAGVSGGADSLALALLADGWARERGGQLRAFIVDHGLRPEAAAEASQTAAELTARGIDTHILKLRDLRRGPGMAERARAARFAALTTACATAGITDLLLGHHAADQAETVLIRALSASGLSGFAGMAALREFSSMRILRPLLGVAPAALRQHLHDAGLAWVEDASNTDPSALRSRIRALRADRAGDGPATRGLAFAARDAGRSRVTAEAEAADWLAAHVTLRPEGFAILPPGPFPPAVLAALVRAISGAAYPPRTAALANLAAVPTASTIAGTRLLPAQSLGPGWLLVREAAAMAARIPATRDVVWDNRFRLGTHAVAGLTIGPLGADAAGLRRLSPLPAAVMITLPALRHGEELVAVPHLHFPDAASCAVVALMPATPHPAAAIPFVATAVTATTNPISALPAIWNAGQG